MLVDTLSVLICHCDLSRFSVVAHDELGIFFTSLFPTTKNGAPKKTLLIRSIIFYFEKAFGLNFFTQSYSAMFCRHFDGSDISATSSQYIYIYH